MEERSDAVLRRAGRQAVWENGVGWEGDEGKRVEAVKLDLVCRWSSSCRWLFPEIVLDKFQRRFILRSFGLGAQI